MIYHEIHNLTIDKLEHINIKLIIHPSHWKTKERNTIHLSDIVAIFLKATIKPRSGLALRFCHLPSDDENKSLLPPPVPLAMTVDSPPSVRSGFEGPPTRFGSLSPDSLAKVLHSDVSSMECDSSTKPHSEQTVSPAPWSKTTSVTRLQSPQYTSAIDEWNWCWVCEMCSVVCYIWRRQGEVALILVF